MTSPTRARRRITAALAAAITAGWGAFVIANGHLGRAAEHVEVSAAMVFGSFLSGSSPVGGGSVAFPVLTKALEVPATAARTFGLSVQAVGMTVASVAILATGRAVLVRVVVVVAATSSIGLVATMAVLGDAGPFRPLVVEPAWAKAVFTVVFATTALTMLHHRRHDHPHRRFVPTRRWSVGIAVTGLVGGVLSALTGTGTNIVVFVVLVVLAGVPARLALPTAILAMAATAVVGFVLLGIVDGHLSIELVDGDVRRVGDVAVAAGALSASRGDLFGIWLAAVPVVVWGAPLGAWVAGKVGDATIIALVAALAVVEVASTVLLVDDIRSNAAMATMVIAGSVLGPVVLVAARRRLRIPLDGVDPGER